MKKRLQIILTIFLVCIIGCTNVQSNPTKSFTLSFINIGKGDAFLLDVPDDGFYLCDTGKREDFARIARLLKLKNVDHIKGIFLSHGHLDHTGNIDALLKQIKTDAVYISKKDDASYVRCPIRDIVQENGVKLIELEGGEHFNFHDLQVDIWLPDFVDYNNQNNNSMILYLTYGKTHFLMTGDMEVEEELLFLQDHPNLDCDVLKLGHHGEKDATSIELLQAIKPKYGIITGNKKENPQSVNKKIQNRLKDFQVQPYYSQGKQLAFDFISDKKKISIQEVDNPKAESDIVFKELNATEHTITLYNESDQVVDLSDYGIRGKKEEAWLFIEKGTILPANECLSLDWTSSVEGSMNIYDASFQKIDEKDWE